MPFLSCKFGRQDLQSVKVSTLSHYCVVFTSMQLNSDAASPTAATCLAKPDSHNCARHVATGGYYTLEADRPILLAVIVAFVAERKS